ncbi:uncharacterized protein LOC144950971 [Lampetra fluviatilis]
MCALALLLLLLLLPHEVPGTESPPAVWMKATLTNPAAAHTDDRGRGRPSPPASMNHRHQHGAPDLDVKNEDDDDEVEEEKLDEAGYDYGSADGFKVRTDLPSEGPKAAHVPSSHPTRNSSYKPAPADDGGSCWGTGSCRAGIATFVAISCFTLLFLLVSVTFWRRWLCFGNEGSCAAWKHRGTMVV